MGDDVISLSSFPSEKILYPRFLLEWLSSPSSQAAEDSQNLIRNHPSLAAYIFL